MKCPICDMNVWRIEYRPDVNIISLYCQNCDCSNIDLNIHAINIDYEINTHAMNINDE